MSIEHKTAIIPEGTTVIGPYTPAIESGGFIFCSGNIGLDHNGNLPNDIESQTKNVFERITSTLQAGGCKLDDVVKATVFLADMEYYGKMNEIYAQYFKSPYPARSAFAVKGLPKGALIEIEVIARKSKL
jgi:2-iminobutanoate/2-iminopropanoate deaminase